jgi:hypothetical protein
VHVASSAGISPEESVYFLKLTALTQVDNKILSGNNEDPLISTVEHGFGQTLEIPV